MNDLNYYIKTHKPERVYNTPHFYILNKGLNSGRPMNEPCPNCFTITTETKEQRNTLFYLCLSLQPGKFFNKYLVGSVIPFIRIDDVREVLDTALQNYEKDNWELKAQKLMKITIYENNLRQQLKTIAQLKLALLRT